MIDITILMPNCDAWQILSENDEKKIHHIIFIFIFRELDDLHNIYLSLHVFLLNQLILSIKNYA